MNLTGLKVIRIRFPNRLTYETALYVMNFFYHMRGVAFPCRRRRDLGADLRCQKCYPMVEHLGRDEEPPRRIGLFILSCVTISSRVYSRGPDVRNSGRLILPRQS